MKKTNLFLLSCITLLLSSCYVHKALYSISLASVERPQNHLEKNGQLEISSFKDGDIPKYSYTDSLIDIVWYVSSTQFNFELKNKTNHTIKINWDDISYVDCNGRASRVIHQGILLADRNNAQAPLSIPRGALIKDLLLPVDNIIFVGGWQYKTLIPSYYKSEKQKKENATSYLNRNLMIMMPIIIEGVKNDYSFIFNIDKVLN